MTSSHPEAHRTPPQSRPLLRVVENFRPAGESGGDQAVPEAEPDPGTAAPGPGLLETLASADRRIDSLAARIASFQGDVRLTHEALAEAESTLRTRSLLVRTAVILLLPALATLAVASVMALPQLTALASAPYPPISAALASVADSVHERVVANQLLLTLFLPATSILIVFASALVLRLKWRRGLAVSER